MDCQTFRRHANAFADGELEAGRNAEAAEHVASCTPCEEIVDAIGAMKSAINRAHTESAAPPELKSGLLAALDVETRVPTEPASIRRISMIIPLGMAAAVAAAALLWWPVGGEQQRGGMATVVPGRAVADIRQQHTICSRGGGSHHEPGLSRDPDTIGKVLSAGLELAVIVPDFSGNGFELVGVARCGIRGRRGAHALYRQVDSGAELSVFTVTRMDSLRVQPVEAAPGHSYFVAEGTELSILAWHDGGQTYALCGPIPRASMIELVERVRMTDAFSPTIWLASVGLGRR